MDRLSRKKEKELIQKCKMGDSEAMSQIYEAYKEELLKSATRLLKNCIEAEDAVSEAFINFFKSIEKFELNYPVRPWLHKILKNEATSQLLKHNKLTSSKEDFIGLEFSEPSEEEKVFNSEEVNYVRKALLKLKREEREVLTYFYFDELSIREISSILSIPEGTVKSRLFTARASLSQKIKNLMEKKEDGKEK